MADEALRLSIFLIVTLPCIYAQDTNGRRGIATPRHPAGDERAEARRTRMADEALRPNPPVNTAVGVYRAGHEWPTRHCDLKPIELARIGARAQDTNGRRGIATSPGRERWPLR